jgi:hypothetical protein
VNFKKFSISSNKLQENSDIKIEICECVNNRNILVLGDIGNTLLKNFFKLKPIYLIEMKLSLLLEQQLNKNINFTRNGLVIG